ncbi:MAG: zinc-dependent alcohol dehydrogenase family protein [Planctomycetota bacterium]
MKAVLLRDIAPIENKPLTLTNLPDPEPKQGQILIRVSVCGLCHTELDEIEGRLALGRVPIVLGHQAVGTVAGLGTGANKFRLGDRVGVTWLYSSCGTCKFCTCSRENLCPDAKWTGKDAHGGYAEYMVIGQNYAHPVPSEFSDVQAAPLLCAGVIGYRALKLAGLRDGQVIGLFGFGASAHIVIQIIRHKFPRTEVFVFTRSEHHRQLAQRLGASWTGSCDQHPPSMLDRAIDFTPAGESVKAALRKLAPGGRLVINTIRKETPIPQLDYTEDLWHEKEIKTVANVTRNDAAEFLPIAAQIPINSEVQEFPFTEANKALLMLKQGRLKAAGVLRITN